MPPSCPAIAALYLRVLYCFLFLYFFNNITRRLARHLGDEDGFAAVLGDDGGFGEIFYVVIAAFDVDGLI